MKKANNNMEYFELTNKDGKKRLVCRRISNVFPHEPMSEECRKQHNERERTRKIVKLPRVEILTKEEFFWRYYQQQK